MTQSIYIGNNVCLARTNFGAKIFVDSTDVSLAPHIILDGDWEGWITEFVASRLQSGTHFIDVGANVGWYALLAAKRGCTVTAFEPIPNLAELIERSAAVNGFHKRLKVRPHAVWNVSTTIDFAVAHRYRGSSGAAQYVVDGLTEYGDSYDRIRVDTTTLDQEFPKGSAKVEFIKIDAEGSESHVLDGGREMIHRDWPQILIEATATNSEAWKKLVSWGYDASYVDTSSALRPFDGALDENGWAMLYMEKR